MFVGTCLLSKMKIIILNVALISEHETYLLWLKWAAISFYNNVPSTLCGYSYTWVNGVRLIFAIYTHMTILIYIYIIYIYIYIKFKQADINQ